MAERRARVRLTLNDNYTGRMALAARAAVALNRVLDQQGHLLDRIERGPAGPHTWEGDGA